MFEILFSFVVFVLVVLGMGLGLILGRKSIKGSCGGLKNIPGIESDCGGACRRPCKKRRGKAHARDSDENHKGNANG